MGWEVSAGHVLVLMKTPNKLHSRILAQKIAALFANTLSIIQLTAEELSKIVSKPACLGALIGDAVCCFVLAIAGGVWGAIVRAAPCYGGGEPSRIEGAMFGAFAVFVIHGWW